MPKRNCGALSQNVTDTHSCLTEAGALTGGEGRGTAAAGGVSPRGGKKEAK